MKTSARLCVKSLLPVVVVCASACAIDAADPATTREAPRLGDVPRAHLMPVPGAAPRFSGASGAGGAHMVYRGGPVISNVEVVTVFWGANVPNQSALGTFYGTILNNPYVDWLSEYDTPTQNIGRGSFVSSYVDTNAPSDSQISDDQIQQELGQLIDQGAVAKPDTNTLFMVHFPAGVSISMQGALSCQQFCAYHSSFSHGAGNVYYGVMPDFSSGGCESCGGESTAWNNTTVVASHEVAEAMTDPNIGVANATQDEHQLAWYDDTNDEIGDVCQGQSATIAGYRVTKLWSNQANACIATKSSTGTGGGGTGSSSSSSSSGGTGSSSSSSSGGTGSGSSSSSSSSSGGHKACSHSVCRPGAPLAATCGSCTSLVCEYDVRCCVQAWEPSCVWEAEYLCGAFCP